MLFSQLNKVILCTFIPLRNAVVYADVYTKTYWFDDSCSTTDNKEVKNAFKTAIYIAGRAGKRLDDNGDHNIDRALQKVFQLSKADSDDKEDIEVLKSRYGKQSGLTEVTGNAERAKSDLRIYCDQDARWQPLPDIPGDPNPNSQRNDDTKEYYDSTNLFRLKNGDIKGTCRDPMVMANTIGDGPRMEEGGDEQPNRWMMTICNNALSNLPDLAGALALTDLKQTERGNLQYFDGHGIVTILHELSHIRWFGNTDDEHEGSDGGEVSGYTWAGILALTRVASSENADSFAFFAILAYFLDYQWKLSDNDNDAKNGMVVKDKSLPLLQRPQDVYHEPPDSDDDDSNPGSSKRWLELACKALGSLSMDKRCVPFVG